MTLRTEASDATCTECGAVHVVTYTYSSFSRANSEHEIAKCRCGAILVRERCLGLQANLK